MRTNGERGASGGSASASGKSGDWRRARHEHAAGAQRQAADRLAARAAEERSEHHVARRVEPRDERLALDILGLDVEGRSVRLGAERHESGQRRLRPRRTAIERAQQHAVRRQEDVIRVARIDHDPRRRIHRAREERLVRRPLLVVLSTKTPGPLRLSTRT